MADQNLMDKSLRSVFVGNIPYEATEEKLKDIFSEAGPVLSFKLVYDRETGKPKGYGFCEYKDQETALSAMRNLNGYEIGGRTLRVDNACTEKSRMEMQILLQGPVIENPYGDTVEPERAPEAISKAVASLPPEQMFELMKQMKLCCLHNPVEAKTMLMQNPQLAYALLQAQVVMRIVDPATASSILHKANPVPKVSIATEKPMPPILPVQAPVVLPAAFAQPPVRQRQPEFAATQAEAWPAAGPNIPLTAARLPLQVPVIPTVGAFGVAQDLDMRQMDPRAAVRPMDQDLRIQPITPMLLRDPRQAFPAPDGRDYEPPQHMESAESQFPRDPRRDRDMRTDPRMDSRSEMRDPRADMRDPRGDPRLMYDPRQDPRAAQPMSVPMHVPQPRLQPVAPPIQQSRPVLQASMTGGATSDQEKAQLIMQVLQLSDEQIALLPPEQRQSILVLKEQIAKSTQR